MLISSDKIKYLTEKCYKEFCNSLNNPSISQNNILSEILNINSNSKFGKQYNFSAISNSREYQSTVPICKYDNISERINNIADGSTNVLYSDTTISFEETSGTTSGSKLIPFTMTSFRYLQNGIFPWLYNLLSTHPSLANGTMYWSISPQTRDRLYTKANIPIGLNSDIEYFGKDIALEIAKHSIAPDNALHNNNFNKWQFLTAYQLLCAKDLSFISIWSPTYILEIFNYIQINVGLFVELFRTGSISDTGLNMNYNFTVDPKRADLISSAITGSHINTKLLWPEFKIISCWTHGSSATFSKLLARYFSTDQIQGKGLLATEGIMSIPFCDSPDPILSINSGFYEFVDETNVSYLCNELEIGKEYRLIITMPNGLYRYDTGDQVKITGFYRNTPMLRFVGRSTLTSDLCGEKLTDAFVSSHLSLINGFAMLSPEIKPKPHYVLFLDNDQYRPSEADLVTHKLENKLLNNPQYAYARKLGQLDNLIYKLIDNPTAKYLDHELKRGKILGDIKPPFLRPETDWVSKLCHH